MVQNSAKPASQRVERDLQGQDYNDVASPQPALKRPSLTDALPSSKVICDSKFGMESQLHFLMQDPLHQSGSAMSFPLDNSSASSSNVSCTGSESQGWPSSESKDENDVPFGQPGSCSTYKLFGVSLIDSQPELPSPQLAAYSKIPSALSFPPMSQSSIYATIRAAKSYGSMTVVTPEKRCKKCRSVRSCTKVQSIYDLTIDDSVILNIIKCFSLLCTILMFLCFQLIYW